MDEQEYPIADEIAVEQRIIPFEGDDLAAARASGGEIYLSIPGVCRALGLDHRSQLRRMQASRVIARGMRRIELQTSKGLRKTNCLTLRKVALWLASVETARMVDPHAIAKIERYQEDLEPFALAVFLKTFGAPHGSPAVQPDDGALVMMPDNVQGVELFLEEHIRMLLDEHLLPQLHRRFDEQALQLEQILGLLVDLVGVQNDIVARQEATEADVARLDERTQGLNPKHKRAIKDKIDLMVAASKHQATPLTYVFLYGRLKHKFNVTKYDEISDSRFTEVVAFLESFIVEGGVEQSQLF